MRKLKKGDEVKDQLGFCAGIMKIIEFIGEVVILQDDSGKLFLRQILDIKKVEKEVPSHGTKVLAWDGKRPNYPRILYSFGQIKSGGELQCFHEGDGNNPELYYENWEVI